MRSEPFFCPLDSFWGFSGGVNSSAEIRGISISLYRATTSSGRSEALRRRFSSALAASASVSARSSLCFKERFSDSNSLFLRRSSPVSATVSSLCCNSVSSRSALSFCSSACFFKSSSRFRISSDGWLANSSRRSASSFVANLRSLRTFAGSSPLSSRFSCSKAPTSLD